MPTEIYSSVSKKRLATTKAKPAVKAKYRKKTEDPDKIFAKLEEKEKVDSEGEGMTCH